MNSGRSILTYHNIACSHEGLHLYDVALSDFDEQMKLLRALPGLHVSTLNQAVTSDGRHIALTFDDGYASWAHEVLEVLTRHELKAHFFVCVENIYKWSASLKSNDYAISREDIVRLKDAGMVIGSHAMKHRFLHRLDMKDIDYELSESKKILEDIVGKRVTTFSVPRGMYNQNVIDAAKRAGYEHVYTSDIGINADEGFLQKRIPICRTTTLGVFKDIVNGRGIRAMAARQMVKNSAKALLGIENYNRVRSIVVAHAE